MNATRWIVLAIALCCAACGRSQLGEECDTSGATDECVDGTVCTNEAGLAVCRKLCERQEDCASTETCNGISGSNLKSCQPAAI